MGILTKREIACIKRVLAVPVHDRSPFDQLYLDNCLRGLAGIPFVKVDWLTSPFNPDHKNVVVRWW